MDGPRPERPPGLDFWEINLAQKVAQAFRTPDREELAAELARKLLDLKNNPNLAVRNWKAYAAKFLYNKAANWVRDARAREKREAGHVIGKEDGPRTPGQPATHEDHTDRAAFGPMWNELSPELRHVWEVLVEEEGSQTRVARRLGKHRNTVRLCIKKILAVAERHGFQGHR